MQHDDQVLGQFLVDAGMITRSALEQARARQQEGQPLSRALIDIGIMGEDEVRRASAHALGVPFVLLDPHDVLIEALVLIPEPLSRARSIVAFAEDAGAVSVAVLDLADLEALSELQMQGHFGGRRVVPHLTTRDSLTRSLLKYQKHLREKFGEMLGGGMRMAEALIGHALYSRAGGAQVDLSTHGALVRYQVGHALHEAMKLPEQAGRALAEQLKTLARLLPVARPQEGKFTLEQGSDSVRVHVSTTPTVGGERIHVRFARQSLGQQGHTLESLGFHGEGLAALRQVLARRQGLVVVSGASGSGVTTLLYTMLDLLQHPGLAIATVEEHVEYRLPYAAQTEAGGGVSAAAALRSALKQHPDVIMVGDVRTSEVASLAAAAAARGVFVIAGTADESYLAEATAVVRVALARRLATNQFAHTAPLNRGESEALEPAANFTKIYEALKDEQIIESNIAWKDVAFAHPTPSTTNPDGYLPAGTGGGYIGLQEVLAPGYDCLTIVEDALFKSAQGQTSVEEALRLSNA